MSGKVGHQLIARKDKLALANFELETKRQTLLLHQAQGLSDDVHVTSKDTIIKVKEGQIQLSAFNVELPKFSGQVVDGQGKQERPEGITLLDTRGGSEGVATKLQVGAGSVAPVGPLSQARELLTTPLQELLTSNRVERVLEVKLKKALALVAGTQLSCFSPLSHQQGS